ncbi:LytTR family DNA-binding domain-containing protein [Streptococcus dentasini]
MRLEIINDKTFKETLVKIYTSYVDKKTQHLINWVEYGGQYIYGFIGTRSQMVSPDDIIRVYTSDKKVYFETIDREHYQAKRRLYQLEEELPRTFVRISQGELVNITYIKRLDLSIKGTIQVVLKNGERSFVSRRSIKKFKKALGV